jgi:hypothetical protein
VSGARMYAQPRFVHLGKHETGIVATRPPRHHRPPSQQPRSHHPRRCLELQNKLSLVSMTDVDGINGKRSISTGALDLGQRSETPCRSSLSPSSQCFCQSSVVESFSSGLT